MGGTNSSEPVRESKSEKAIRSTDWGLKFAPMKLESLVIANQNVAVNTFSGLVHTARQTMRVGNTRSRWPNLKRKEPSKAGLMIGVKS